MNSPTSPATASHATSDLSLLIKVLIRWLWLFCLTFLAIFSLAVIYLLTATPYYRATTVLQVEQEKQRAFNPDNKSDQSEDLKSEDILKTIEQNLQSPKLFVGVVSDPKINKDPDFLTGMASSSDALSPPELAEILRNNTTVSLRRGTRLIDVSVDHAVPAMAQKLAKAIVDEYISESGQTQTTTSTGVETQLLEDSARIKQNLQKSEDALATYRGALLLKDRISDQQRILDALQQRYRAKHPTLIQARALMAELEKDFDGEVQKIRTASQLETGYWNDQDAILTAQAPEDRIQTELRLVEARTNVLDGEVETERSLFNSLLKQRSEANMSKEAAPTEVRIVEEPYLPHKPIRPRKSIILAIGFAGGIVAGMGLVLLLNALDSSFKTSEEVEQYLRIPVLGSIPQVKSSEPPQRGPGQNKTTDNIILITEPGGVAAESFRSMRASLGLLGKAEDHRTLLFTSATGGEGKTFTSCNYATALAQQGLKVLLMDTDLRRPAVHLFFNLENRMGLVEHVAHGTRLEDSLYEDVIPNLDILPAGNKCPNPAEFLAGKGVADTLKQALLKYDRIVVDCSPVNLVSDPLLIVPYVQSVVLVVRAGRTPRRESHQALSALQRAKAQPVGIILNGIPDWSRHLYYAYTGRYSDSYRKVYSDQQSK